MSGSGRRIIGAAVVLSYLAFLLVFSTSIFVQEMLNGGALDQFLTLRG
ncbi:MAG: hypothetical protein ACMUIE_03070 [Thermoplasmatota archaeon]